MFGGYDASSFSGYDGKRSDTWAFDGSDWTKLLDEDGDGVNAPTPRMETAMIYDSGLGKTLLFGGRDDGSLGDTWTFDGNVWEKILDVVREHF